MADFEELKIFWKNRSSLEQRLLILILLLCVILLVILLILIFRGETEYCSSVECIRAATHVLDHVDFSADPCFNFHEFACGEFMKKKSEPSSLNVVKRMEMDAEKQIEWIISGDNENTSVNSVDLQRKFYRSCINVSAIEEDENDTFLTLLDALGGWPVIKHNFWDEQGFDWKITMIKARKLGLSFQKFIGIDLIFDEDKNKTIIQILPPDDVEYISQEIMEPYVESIRDIAILLHAPSLGVNSELRYVANFQNELNRIISKARNRTYETEKLMEINKFQERFPRTIWVQFFNNLMSGATTVRGTDFVSIKSEQYLIDLEVLLLKTSKRTQSNYIIWKTVEKFIPFLTEAVRSRYEKFQRQFSAKFTKISRREQCVALSKELFENAAEIEYIRKNIESSTRKEIKSLFLNLKVKFLAEIRRSFENLDDDVLEELKELKILIGGPEVIFNEERIEEILGYDGLAFFDDDLTKIVTKVSINRVNFFFKQLNSTRKNEDEELILSIIKQFTHANAYYMDTINALILPVPLLNDVFYEKNRPNSMNYGALVSTIGHEIAHSLGKFGNKTYQNRGRFQLEYNQAFFKFFQNSTNCFEEQYERYCNETKLDSIENSNETLEENVADYVGTKLAYDMYEEYINRNGIEPKLPGVELTSNQLFWIMSSTFFCQKSKNEVVRSKAPSFHADGEFRINYRFRNFPEFSRDFHCSSDTFMNPSKRCSFF